MNPIIGYISLGIALVILVFIIYMKRQDNKIKDATSATYSSDEYDVKEIMVQALTQIGCRPEVHDDGSLTVQFQGENFYITFNNSYVRIWDLGWAGIQPDDPYFPVLSEAINKANYGFGPTVVMTEPDDDGTILLHSRYDVLLHPAIPYIEQYIKICLMEFFDTKESVRKYLNDLRFKKQMPSQQNRRHIGFTSDNQETDNPTEL